MKILAMYLPQFHTIKENDEWWGKGYTEWEAVKRAVPLFKGHNQPNKPLNDNYYDLSDEHASAWIWQADLANEYGIYGFCIYHYWFRTGKQLLEKPMEILLNHPEINIKYCICWANESWARNWYGLYDDILMKQEYGDKEEWTNHFNYLLQFFNDCRYIKIDNKPVINIYRTKEIQKLSAMLKVWNELAISNGFAGVYIISGNTLHDIDERSEIVDAYYNFEPGYTFFHHMKLQHKIRYFLRKKMVQVWNVFSSKKRVLGKLPMSWIYENNIKNFEYNGKKCFLGTCPSWDNTPRRKYKGRLYVSSNDEFYKNLNKICEVYERNNRKDDFVYINAWNEWGEGAYLEPDEKNKFSYLEIIKKISSK